MKHHVLCLVDSDESAQEIIEKLTSVGFPEEDITVLNSQQKNADDKAGHEGPDSEKRGEGVGFLSGVGPTVVGGAGGFMAAGGVMPLESGEMGGAEQTASGSLARLGLSDSAGDLYENRLAEGAILISVKFNKDNMEKVAKEIFENAHGQEISTV
jgi:hypothetical protein